MTGGEFRQWRLDRHLTQQQFGRLLGMSKHTISRIEHNAQRVTPLCELYLFLIAHGNLRRIVAEKVGVTLPVPIPAP